MEWFKYEWIWNKTKAGNFMNANNSPLKLHENICVFSKGTCANRSPKRMNYNPQGVKEVDKDWHRPQKYESEHNYKRPSHKLERKITKEGFPSSVLKFNSVHNPPHPTQKPLDLLEYLINTYTNENDLILDFTCGSGTTLLAARNLKRKCIGIELEEKYCEIAKQRLEEF